MDFKCIIKLWLGILFLLVPVCVGGSSDEQPASDSLKGVELYRQGVEHGIRGEPETALELFRQSLEFRRKAFGDKHIRLGSNYLGMAIQYKNLHQLDNAFRHYKMAEEVYLLHAPANDSRLGDIYSNLGSYFQIKGNLGEAIRYQERAIEIYRNSSDDFPEQNYLSALYNLANSYYLVNREEEALHIAMGIQGKGSFGLRLNCLNLMASIYTSQGDFRKADRIFSQAIDMIREEYGDKDPDLADQYLSYGQFLNITHHEEAALPYLEKAESIYLQYRSRQPDLAGLYNVMAQYWAEKKISSSTYGDFTAIKISNLRVAESWYIKAMELLTGAKNGNMGEEFEIPGSEELRQNNFPMVTLGTLENSGRNYLQLARLTLAEEKEVKTRYFEKAAGYFMAASDLAEYLRTTFVSEESKAQFTALQQDIYSGAVEASYELFSLGKDPLWAETAFLHAERNKASSLHDQITELESRSLSLIPDTLLEQEYEKTTSLAYYREKLHLETLEEEPDQERISEYRQRIFENEEMIVKLREHLEKNYQDYYRLKYEARPVSFGLMREKLNKNEVLLSYSLKMPGEENNGEIYIIALTTKGYQFLRQPFTATDVARVQTVVATLSDSGFLGTGVEAFRAYAESAAGLYRLMLSPLEPLIRDKRITIIPDGLLNYLPFEALLTAPVSTESVHYHDLPYLIHRHAVSYSYSASLFRMEGKSGRTRSVAFAPVYRGFRDGVDDPSYLPMIPGAIEEVTLMEKKMKTTLYTGEDATERKFRESAGDYGILHLAMHTLINDSLPLYSRLAFSPGTSGDLEDDGWLNTADVYNLQLKARMAVLGACRSGGGMLRRGEGVISLARAFFYAGCPSVILSLWEVEDQAGSVIMKEFYKNLKSGKSKDLALRNAKLKYLKEATPVTAHPRLWLGYIIIGNPEPLFGGVRLILSGLMGLLLLLIVVTMAQKKPAGKKPAGPHL